MMRNMTMKKKSGGNRSHGEQSEEPSSSLEIIPESKKRARIEPIALLDDHSIALQMRPRVLALRSALMGEPLSQQHRDHIKKLNELIKEL